jgi:RNA polymerase sigma-70 factor, ECF subfamily
MPEEINNNIVAKAKAGEDSALTAIYETYQPKIQKFLYYRVGNLHAAEDLTTEVFLRVIENLPKYRVSDIPFQAWIFQIARNLAIDYFRRQSVRRHEQIDESVPCNGDGPDAIVNHTLVAERLREALDHLTDGQSDVLVMRFISGLSIAETAQSLNRSEGAVKALQARGLEAMNRVLSQKMVSYDESA